MTVRADRPGRPFRSPAEAQLWFEWRCHGRLLPATALVGLVVSIVVVLNEPGKLELSTFWSALAGGLYPSVSIALILGVVLAKNRPLWALGTRGDEFVAIRPLTDRSLVAAKYGMAWRSVLVTGTVLAVGLVAEILSMARARCLVRPWSEFWHQHPGIEGLAILGLGLVLLPALIWRLLTGNFTLTAGLTNRRWVQWAAGVANYLAFCALGTLGVQFLVHTEVRARVLSGLPWFLAAAATIKVAVSARAFLAAVRRGLIARGAVGGVVLTWVAAIVGLAGLAAWLLPALGYPLGWRVVLPALVVAVPLGRFALAPLALSWSRHRP